MVLEFEALFKKKKMKHGIWFPYHLMVKSLVVNRYIIGSLRQMVLLIGTKLNWLQKV